jgi:hypothetical protein
LLTFSIIHRFILFSFPFNKFLLFLFFRLTQHLKKSKLLFHSNIFSICTWKTFLISLKNYFFFHSGFYFSWNAFVCLLFLMECLRFLRFTSNFFRSAQGNLGHHSTSGTTFLNDKICLASIKQQKVLFTLSFLSFSLSSYPKIAERTVDFVS